MRLKPHCQMCAQRYGTVPIVTLCGGLKDSVAAVLSGCTHFFALLKDSVVISPPEEATGWASNSKKQFSATGFWFCRSGLESYPWPLTNSRKLCTKLATRSFACLTAFLRRFIALRTRWMMLVLAAQARRYFHKRDEFEAMQRKKLGQVMTMAERMLGRDPFGCQGRGFATDFSWCARIDECARQAEL